MSDLEARVTVIEKRLDQQQETLDELLAMRLQVSGLDMRMTRVENHLTRQGLLLERSISLSEQLKVDMTELIAMFKKAPP